MSHSRCSRSARHVRIGRAGLVAILVSGALVFGCGSSGVHADWDATASFETLHKFSFDDPPDVEGANPFADNSLLRKRVREALETTLAERGFVPVPDRERADFVVTYHVLLEDELRVDGVTAGGDLGFWRNRMGPATYSTTTRARSHQEATLVVDVLSAKASELLWRGWGQGMLTTRDRIRSEERLHEGVRAILADFPPEER